MKKVRSDLDPSASKVRDRQLPYCSTMRLKTRQQIDLEKAARQVEQTVEGRKELEEIEQTVDRMLGFRYVKKDETA